MVSPLISTPMAMMASKGAVEGRESSDDDAGKVVEEGTVRSVRETEERRSVADGAAAVLLWVED